MTIRPAPLLAVLTLLASPALAQESAEEPPPPADSPVAAEEASPADAAPPAETPPADAPAPEAAAEAAEPASAPAAPTPTAAGPATAAPGAAPAVVPATQGTIVASPFSPDQRNGWLTQCRSTFQRAGAVLGGANGLPDACETQLLDFERNYVPTADGKPPVIWVRVPVARPAAAAPPPAPEDGDE